MTTPVWVGLGSNLGDRSGILDAALSALADTTGVAVERVSSYLESRPVGGPPGQGPFLNAAARLRTSLDPGSLLAVTQGIEDQLGRVRAVRWSERTLDIDLLIYGTRFLNTPTLKIPHPRLAFRRFVLGPLSEIAPSIVDPFSGWTIADLLANLDRTPRLLVLEGPPGPLRSFVFRGLLEALPGIAIQGGVEHPDPDQLKTQFESFQGDTLARPGRELAVALRRADGSTPDRWLVAEFYLEPIEWRERGRPEATRVLAPTCRVVLPDRPGEVRRRGYRSEPSLWPEAAESESILDEIMATCRGIEGCVSGFRHTVG